MKAIMIMYDSLNLRMLEPYGGDFVKTPNFKRLKQKAVTFDCNYVSSLPCMPARRELHTGRYNFLHRSWGPIEPFDDSMPEILKKCGIYSHLVTDHHHYWEDGGANYHTRYSSFELIRGQEGDPWKVHPEIIKYNKKENLSSKQYDSVNRKYMDCEEKMPQARTFQKGIEFIKNNHEEDEWFLQIETFDPHEPFFTQEEYKKLYPHEYNGEMKDWPPYYFVQEGEDSISHMRHEYAALLTMCDRYLGEILDVMDKYNMWEDTMLIVNTDHGYLLGEHGWWSKCVMPIYEDIARIPLFIYDPKSKLVGERRNALTQTVDIAPTILDFFNIEKPKDMLGKSLLPVIENNSKIRNYGLFGYHEGHINITDGEWVYMLAPDGTKPLYEYTLMPSHMQNIFEPLEFKEVTLVEPFDFTKNCRVMKIEAKENTVDMANYGTRLYNVKKDPAQSKVLLDPEKEAEFINEIIKLMKENDAPVERYTRFGIPMEPIMTKSMVKERYSNLEAARKPQILKDCNWDKEAINMYNALLRFIPEDRVDVVKEALKKVIEENKVTEKGILKVLDVAIPEEDKEILKYMVILNGRTD